MNCFRPANQPRQPTPESGFNCAGDRYFSPTEFREIYATSLPGAQFKTVKSFMGVLWTASSRPGEQQSPTHLAGGGEPTVPWRLDRTADGHR